MTCLVLEEQLKGSMQQSSGKCLPSKHLFGRDDAMFLGDLFSCCLSQSEDTSTGVECWPERFLLQPSRYGRDLFSFCGTLVRKETPTILLLLVKGMG